MNDSDTPGSKTGNDRSVRIGGNASGNVIQTGDRNRATLHFQPVQLPPAASVDLRAELQALRDLLTGLETPDRKKIANALEEADDEAAKPEPDKDEVGKALARALDYAQKAEGFAGTVTKLLPHVQAAAAWLGDKGYPLLQMFGLVI